MEDAHAKPWEDVVDYFRVDVDKGLSTAQVVNYQEKYGPNGELLVNTFFLACLANCRPLI